MTLAGTKDLVEDARSRGVAVVAFNVITLEHAEAAAAAADACGVAVILQISENAVRFHNRQLEPIATATAAVARLAAVPVALHLDHVTDDALLDASLDSVFSSVMYDAGSLPYEQNLQRTDRAVRKAHAAGLWLEAELGYVGGKPDAPQSAHADGVRTDPDEAAEFVRRTGVDALAVAVGSSHAMTEATARLDHDLIARLRDRLEVPLVLHGSSGVSTQELRRAVAEGIVKVNVGTALNVALTRSIRDALHDDPLVVDPRSYLRPAREAMAVRMCEILDGIRGV
jgi:fructose-bisphosphate aldolase class II